MYPILKENIPSKPKISFKTKPKSFHRMDGFSWNVKVKNFLIIIFLGDGKIVLYKAQTPLSTDKPTPYWNNTDKMTKNGPHTLSL